MISQFAHEYVHYDSVGNLTMCQEVIQNSKAKLKQLYNAKNISGYELLLLKNIAESEEQLIEWNFEGVTQCKFPLVYAFIQPVENSEDDFDRLMQELHYTRIDV